MTFAGQTPMSDPGAYGPSLNGAAIDLASAVRVTQGLLIHGEYRSLYEGVDGEDALVGEARRTLPLAERCAQILSIDPRPLSEARPPRLRSVGACRDYALMVCGLMRANGVAARLRCGFAGYFSADPEGYEDHWICEMRIAERWIRADAQLDAEHRVHLGVAFDPLDLHADLYLTAPEAWARFRSGLAEEMDFGQGAARGVWLMAVNLARDALAMQDVIVSEWDRWRELGSLTADRDRLLRIGDELAAGRAVAPFDDFKRDCFTVA